MTTPVILEVALNGVSNKAQNPAARETGSVPTPFSPRRGEKAGMRGE